MFFQKLVAFELTTVSMNYQQQIVACDKITLASFEFYLFANEVPHTFLCGGSVDKCATDKQSAKSIYNKLLIGFYESSTIWGHKQGLSTSDQYCVLEGIPCITDN